MKLVRFAGRILSWIVTGILALVLLAFGLWLFLQNFNPNYPVNR